MGTKDHKKSAATTAGLLWAHRKEVDRLTAGGRWLEAADRLEKIAFLARFQEEREIEQLEHIYRKLGNQRQLQKLLKKVLAAAFQSGNETRFFGYASKLADSCRGCITDSGVGEILHDLESMLGLYAKQHALASPSRQPSPAENVVKIGAQLKIGFTFGGSYFHPLPTAWYQALLDSYDQRRFQLFFYWLPNPGDCSRDQGLGVISQLSFGSCVARRADSQMPYARQLAAMVRALKQDRLNCLVLNSALYAPVWNFIAHLRLVPFQVAILAHLENSLPIDLQYLSEELLPQACGPALGLESLGFPPGLVNDHDDSFDNVPLDTFSKQDIKNCASKWIEDLRERFLERFPEAIKSEAAPRPIEVEVANNANAAAPVPSESELDSNRPIECLEKRPVAEESKLVDSSAGCVVSSRGKKEADRIINQAIEALQRGDTDQALELVVSARGFHYPVQDLEYVRALCHIKKKD
ncbi:MAG: hypothetical protein GX589_04875, partial [Deltaproteobacteria bacterium]|nr:hypothetical protein [Deltaproteobacteria bacterium]